MSESTLSTPDPAGQPAVLLAVSRPLFPLGQVVATPGALELLAQHGVAPVALLSRHVTGDWGQMCRDDACANAAAVKCGDRVLSAYVLPEALAGEAGVRCDRVWVVTEADRSSTCLLLPSEY